MTSIWTVLKEYIKLKTAVYKLADNDSWENFIIRSINNIKISNDCGRFIQLGHSIGNFIPVPSGFNVGRSNWGKWDSWDLTLTQIYQWYMDNRTSENYINNSALERLFANDRYKQSTIENCQNWLRGFETWENFVRENYLESFLDKNGIPKKFFKNHALNYPLPRTLPECEEFFRNANKCIEDRGNTILNYLYIQGYVNDTYTQNNIQTQENDRKNKAEELRQKFQQNPLESASYLVSLGIRVLSIVFAGVCFIQFTLLTRKNDYETIPLQLRNYLPLERYIKDSCLVIFMLIFLFSVLLLGLSYVKRNKGVKRAGMIFIVSSIGLLYVISIVPIIRFVLFPILQKTAWFETWWYYDYTPSRQIFDLIVSLYFIIYLAIVLVSVCWLMIDSYYRFYMKHLLKTLLITLGLIPIVLMFLETKIRAIILCIIIATITIIGLRKRCRSCGKVLALKRIGEQSVQKVNISVPIKNETKDETGKVVATTTQYVPGTRETYDVIYKCKYCGYETRKRKTRDTANL